MTATTDIDAALAGRRIEALVIGGPAGGVDALLTLLPALPAGFRLPVICILHLPPAQGAEAVVGREGVVLGDGLDPDGVVRVAAEEWRAIAPHPLPPGAKVRVTKLDGLVLTVEPLDLEHAQTGGVAPAQGGNH